MTQAGTQGGSQEGQVVGEELAPPELVVTGSGQSGGCCLENHSPGGRGGG